VVVRADAGTSYAGTRTDRSAGRRRDGRRAAAGVV